jgi:endonuclease-3
MAWIAEIETFSAERKSASQKRANAQRSTRSIRAAGARPGTSDNADRPTEATSAAWAATKSATFQASAPPKTKVPKPNELKTKASVARAVSQIALRSKASTRTSSCAVSTRLTVGAASDGVVQSRSVARSYAHEARKRVGPKRERIRPVIERLAREHEAVIALRFRDELELLVSVMLSAQTTDVTVNRVTERLFLKYRRPQDYLVVPPEELEADIRPTGTYRQKARNLRGAMKMLIEEFDGHLPTRVDDLVRLPGVGRKTANVVASERGATQGIVVDTHVRRLSQRLGFTRQHDPVKIERDLQRLVPKEDWARFSHLLIWHGRRVCIARTPRCEVCVLNDLCPSSRV